MPTRERRKGSAGESAVRRIYESHGFTVRGLEGEGDHLVMREGLTIFSECKRQETARVWLWREQASTEAPAGAVPVVAFRRSRSPWLALIALDDLARLLA